ncbi:MAG: MFS transporter [Clostridia bacterium]|nr:MFS transporter [Clostridia bacterium]
MDKNIAKSPKDKYALSRVLYIIEAALEYFVSIAVGGVYLAEITKHIGISDAITGIITAFVSLGCGFQIIALFLAHKKPVKKWVTVGHIISQTLFALMYFVPLLNASKTLKTVLLITVLFVAQIIHNVINSPKINWLMGLVDDDKRGNFTANKEIVSLVGGMIFSYGLGAIMDHLASKTMFIVGGVILFVLLGLHTLTLVFTKEKKTENVQVNVKKSIGELVKNKTLFKIIIVFVIWNVANYATISFSGAYQVNALGFTTTFASVVVIISSLARVIFSKPLGKFADKYSFCKMLYICFGIEAVAFAINIFTVPQNGKILFTAYSIIHAIGQAGINSAIINLAYDYVSDDQKTGAVALVNTFSGFAGFFTTLALSPLVAYIQNNGNKLFGISMHPQQLLSLFSLVFTIVILIYLFTVISKIPSKKNRAE